MRLLFLGDDRARPPADEPGRRSERGDLLLRSRFLEREEARAPEEEAPSRRDEDLSFASRLLRGDESREEALADDDDELELPLERFLDAEILALKESSISCICRTALVSTRATFRERDLPPLP